MIERPDKAKLLNALDPRLNATQAMTFEWVKWRRGPRTRYRARRADSPANRETENTALYQGGVG
jgi:hypothetical protein